MRVRANVVATLLPLCVSACAPRCGAPSPADDVADSDTDAVVTDTDDTDGGDTDASVDSDDTDDTDDSDGAPVVTSCVLGAGDGTTPTTWEALEDGAEVGVFVGGQGRWHVFGLVRCDGLVGGGQSGSASGTDLGNPDNPTVSWGVYDDTNTLLAGYETLKRPMAREADAALLNELLVFWTASTFEESIDRDATLRFTVTDVAGGSWSDEVTVRLVDGTPDTDAP